MNYAAQNTETSPKPPARKSFSIKKKIKKSTVSTDSRAIPAKICRNCAPKGKPPTQKLVEILAFHALERKQSTNLQRKPIDWCLAYFKTD